MKPPETDEFYIGWEDRAPAAIGRRVKRCAILLVVAGLLSGVLLAVAQCTIGGSGFEWGTIKAFTGILQSEPYPHLLVARPGRAGEAGAYSSYYLVAPFKFGLNPGNLAALTGKLVNLKGTLIYRANQTMVEVQPSSITVVDTPGSESNVSPVDAPQSLGQQTLVGEIVDSKCYLGVMNPGQLTPHRACAIRCISGGIPPILLVRPQDGPPRHLLLVSSAGKPVNRQVLGMVAESVEITGEVVRQGELLILRADPSTYRRVAR